ncbi:Striatin, N-terminal [Kalmanozyma brasiliensis GHG001]|uniref:Striatin N-terminal domain-containing protein n=1 Tax=Kalmanozyma brasiliensis (strain GHG001) TaxID=1365824 RepID=V5EC55_KALBG|nr:Striatin, N-terminal [Kalmanozyma brasiliensis GHG001]EST08016.1 Striatin, N-terminal [Kalmanozyma brasiliensis GHG001]
MFLSNAGNMSMGNNNANANGGNMGAGLGFGMNNNSNQMHGNMANGVQSQETGNSNSNSEYTLAGILHHLQGEWRRYEKDRNEWEIERAEMRARIALLEGERRGVENLKTDLMRRVKMLEYALRQERTKYLSSSGSAQSPQSSTAPQVKNPLLHSLEKGTTMSSGRSSPAPFAESAPTASAIAAAGGSSLNASALAGGLPSRSTSSAKDPKSRAKSREYLKQCLQEISYLTSATTLNPLPDRGIASGSSANGANMQNSLRPRKTMLESVPPTLAAPTESHAAMAGSISRASAATALGVPSSKTGRPGRSPLFASEAVVEEGNETEEVSGQDFQAEPGQREDNAEEQQQQPSSGASSAVPLRNPLSATFIEPEPSSLATSSEPADAQEQDEAPGSSNSSDSSRSTQSTDSRGTSGGSMTDQEVDEQEQVTAIFKPGGRDWQKLKEAGIQSRELRESQGQGQAGEEASLISEAQQQLAITSEKVNQLMNRSGKASGSERTQEEDLANISLATEDEEAAKDAADTAADSLLWKSKKVLRSHLDAVRAVTFLQNEMTLLSASDDNTIKFWNLDVGTLSQPASKSGTDSQPLVTFRGHSAAVTCLAVSPNKRRFYSGSLDSSIRVWQLPDQDVEAYPPFEKSMELGCLVGHSQAVWDLALLPDRSDEEGRLVSASADGTVKVWSVRGSSASPTASNGEATSSASPAELQLSWDYFGSEPSADTAKERENLEKGGALPVPTCVEACHSDLRLVAVSYSNSVVKLFDLDSGRQMRQLKSDETFDGTAETQINKLVTHPTLPMLITAHEDGYIRMFDLDTGACTLSMVAHLDAVTSLDIDASGLTLVSGGHDCSVRFWDIAGGSLAGKEGATAGEGDKSTAVCRQEISSHRNKASEGVLAVKYHPTAPYFASAGADGVIRIYG